ncbi:MAG TPA: Xaa-Pro peptidase family protein [Polyangiaceae bacterium]
MREALVRHRCDALVCAQPRHVLMLSGHWPVVGNAWAVATKDGRVLLIVPEDELEPATTGWADAVYTFRAVSLDRLESALVAVREPLGKALEVAGAETIAYEAEGSLEPSTYVSQFNYGAAGPAVLHDLAPRARLFDADAWLARLRVRKTRAELEHMRTVATVARAAYEQGVAAIRPGLTERDVASAFEAAFESGIPGDARGRAFFYCMSGANAAESNRAYQRTRSRRIERGDVVIVHCNSVIGGFWTDLTRTYVLGKESELVIRLEAIAAARAAAIAHVAPGVEARAVDAAARAVLEAYGFGPEFRTPTGHGVGFAAIDHDELPRLHPISKDVLEAGMTFNIEPGCYRRGLYGMRHGDMIAVAPEGCEVLSPFQTEPAALVI